MIETYRKIARLLSPAERRSAALLFLLMLASAMLEVVGVASIMPFVAVLSDPAVVENNDLLNAAYRWLGIESQTSFLILLGIALLILFLSSLALKACNAFLILRFSQMRIYSFSYALLCKYASLPYEFFLNRNSADLSRLLFSEVNEVVGNIILPSLRLLSSCLVVISIFTLLLFVDPLVMVALVLSLGSGFVLIYFVSRRLLARLGQQRVKDNRDRFVLASETLGGIKELRLMGRENTYLERFRTTSRRFALQQSTAKAIGDLPHFAIQGVAFGGILALVLYLTGRYGGIQGAMPLIALYAFAGYRLLPAFQELYKNGTQLNYYAAGLDNLQADLSAPSAHRVPKGESIGNLLDGDVVMKNVSYAFPGSESVVVKGLTLTIPKGSCVAFVGTTGAGKSTTIDLIMGLLQPSSGVITIGRTDLNNDTLFRWQRNIGYVPQSIYLADASVAENIAFGVEPSQVDMAAVHRAARLAQIDEFVTCSMPEGYNTHVGERGARLSGGQRQRIGIARALYHNPQVLIFDEATSALDNQTESAVMDAVNQLAGQKTIILIAHRLSTVKRCDMVFLLENGRLVGQGSFDELSASSEAFGRFSNPRP